VVLVQQSVDLRQRDEHQQHLRFEGHHGRGCLRRRLVRLGGRRSFGRFVFDLILRRNLVIDERLQFGIFELSLQRLVEGVRRTKFEVVQQQVERVDAGVMVALLLRQIAADITGDAVIRGFVVA